MRTRDYQARVDEDQIEAVVSTLIAYNSERFVVADDRAGNGGYVVTAALEDRIVARWRVAHCRNSILFFFFGKKCPERSACSTRR